MSYGFVVEGAARSTPKGAVGFDDFNRNFGVRAAPAGLAHPRQEADGERRQNPAAAGARAVGRVGDACFCLIFAGME